jgi:hypothetical protein
MRRGGQELTRGRATGAADLGGGRAWLVVAAFAAAWISLTLAIHRESPRTLISAHGLLHAAIAQRFDAEPLRVPPENPFCAGRPLAYYWAFHWVGAAVARTLGTDPIHAFEFMILGAVAVLALAAGALAGSVYRRTALGAVIAYLVVAGANPQAPLVLAARVARHGASILRDDPAYLWGIVRPFSAEMRLFDPYGMYGPLANIFWNITARPIALAALVVALAALRAAWTRGGAGPLAALAVSVAACGAFGSVVAIAVAGGLALAIAAVAAPPLRARLAPGAVPRRPLATLAAIAAGLLFAGPTFAHLFGAASGGAGILSDGAKEHATRLLTMASSAWLLVVLAVVGCRRAPAAERGFLAALSIAAAALFGLTALVSLPVGNQDNLFHAGLVLLAVPAAGAVLAPQRAGAPARVARARAAVVIAAFLPGLALLALAYTRRPPVPIGFAGREIVRVPDASPSAQLYAWIRRTTDPRAVFVIDPRPPIRASAGNTAELPAMTRRAILTERRSHYLVKPYDDAAQRERTAVALVSGEPLSPEDERALAQLARPVYVVSDDAGDASLAARLRALWGDPEFLVGSTAVYRWRDGDGRDASRAPVGETGLQ